MSRPHLTAEFIETQYIKLNKSIAVISKEQNISRYKLENIFKHYNIPFKPIGSHRITTQGDKIRRILHTYPFATKEFMLQQYVDGQKSLPDLHAEFGINYYQTKLLLKHYDIPIRSISQAANTNNFKTKLHNTLKSKYGVETNISQVESIKKRKAEKCLTQFGVDNFFKRHDFKPIKEEGYQRRYGMSCSDWRAKASSEAWSNKTEDEKKRWLISSIQSDNAKLKSIKGYRESKGEIQISEALASMQIMHTRQFIIKYTEDVNSKRYFYDLFVPELNLLIEFNGDYWHANPEIYKAEDIIKYPFGSMTAAEKWKRDEHKMEIARKRNYSIIVVWEREINNISNDQLIQLIKNKIYAKC